MSTHPSHFVNVPGSVRSTAAERAYRLLLRAYPPAFRAEYGRDMTQLFRDQCRLREAGTIEFWMRVMWDVAQSAPALRMEAWRARGHDEPKSSGATMKFIAMLATLLGVFGCLSAVAEGSAGLRQGWSGTSLLAILLGLVAGALLLAAGVAAFRSTSGGRRIATRSAIASLVLFLVARGLFGWMSIFSQFVGVTLPLVILAALHWPRRRDPSALGTP